MKLRNVWCNALGSTGVDDRCAMIITRCFTYSCVIGAPLVWCALHLRATIAVRIPCCELRCIMGAYKPAFGLTDHANECT